MLITNILVSIMCSLIQQWRKTTFPSYMPVTSLVLGGGYLMRQSHEASLSQHVRPTHAVLLLASLA